MHELPAHRPDKLLHGRRKGRPLHTQKKALIETLLPQLQLVIPEKGYTAAEALALFPTPVQDLSLEIGFGSGDHLASQALTNPTTGFFGCEPFINGVANLLTLIDKDKQPNIRLLADDARKLLDALPDACLTRSFLLFPDPWPKARHKERRFICPENMDRFARTIKQGGELRLATDMPFLANWMEKHASAHPAFALDYKGHQAPTDWIRTRYEQKGLDAGRAPIYLCYKRL